MDSPGGVDVDACRIPALLKKLMPPGFNPRNPIHWLAFGLGSGLSPRAPGTMGSLAALPFFWILAVMPWPVYVGWLLLCFVLGVWVCEVTSRDLGVHDFGGIVFDEFVGQWLTLLPLVLLHQHHMGWLMLGFVLFRFFDIVKPWPIRWLDEKVGGGFGIMIDDVLAGLMAAVVLMLCLQAIAGQSLGRLFV